MLTHRVNTIALLIVLFLSLSIAACSAAEGDTPVTRSYLNVVVDQPHGLTLQSFQGLVEASVTGWNPSKCSIEHGPDHRLVVTASEAQQEEVVNVLLGAMAQHMQDFEGGEFSGLLSAE
ncbi:MAG: hypothetical protein WD009_05700 [Phycisphaeraceae bacterium]